MPGGDTDLDARDRLVDEPASDAFRADEPAPVAASDIDPLMADAPAPALEIEAERDDDGAPAELVEPGGRRRWWSRLVEWETPNGNGHHGPDDVDVHELSHAGNGSTALGAAPDAVDTDAVVWPVQDEHRPEPTIDVPEAHGPDDDHEPDPVTAPVALLTPERERPAWHTVPLTDLPDERDPDLLEVAPFEPARTGDIPRVPVMATERATLVPEPEREPTWLQRRRARRPRVRRVNRVVRRIDSWTVFKVALLFWIVAYVILVVAGVLLWSVAVSTGTIDNVESFVKDLLALDTFTFDGQKIFRASWVLGAFMAVAGTGLTVTMAVLYNLFSDLVGGVRVTVLEEEVVQRPPS